MYGHNPLLYLTFLLRNSRLKKKLNSRCSAVKLKNNEGIKRQCNSIRQCAHIDVLSYTAWQNGTRTEVLLLLPRSVTQFIVCRKYYN